MGPQWSPPTIDGNTRPHSSPPGNTRKALQWSPPSHPRGRVRGRVGCQRPGGVAAMEPAVNRRENGSDDPGCPTRADRSSRERPMFVRGLARSMDLSRCKKCPLTCMPALLSFRGTTSALAAQTMTVPDESSFSRSHRVGSRSSSHWCPVASLPCISSAPRGGGCENVRSAEASVSALIGSPDRRLKDGEDAACGQVIWPQAAARLRYQGLIGDERSGDVAGAWS